MAATIVDWAALGTRAAASPHSATGAVAFAACGCLVAVGLYVMFTSK